MAESEASRRGMFLEIKKWLELEEKETETDASKNRGCEITKKLSGQDEKETVRKKKDLRSLMEEETNVVKTVVMNYDTNHYKLSADIVKEAWVVGGIQDTLFRSRSC
ncbi:hypothetical protein Bca4012_093730 [Brassica carinata]